MEIPVSMGQWIASMSTLMANANEGDVFLLPTRMHEHAFDIIKTESFSNKNLRVKLRQDL